MSPVDLPILDDLRVAAPCPARWDQMTGDDRARFCPSCRKTVYDLSNLTRAEALALVARPGDPPCVRFYRRGDGTILTADCPVGLLTRADRWRRRAVAATLALVAGTAGATESIRRVAESADPAHDFPGPPSPPGVAARVGDRVSGWVDDALVAVGLRRRAVAGALSISVTMGKPMPTLGKPAPVAAPGQATCPTPSGPDVPPPPDEAGPPPTP